MSRMSKRAVLGGLAGLSLASQASARIADKDIREVKIWFMHWNSQTRAMVSPEAMQNGYYDSFRHIQNDYIAQKLVQKLQLDEMNTGYINLPNTRLVIQVSGITGSDIYCSGGDYLSTLDAKQFRPIDEAFKTYFQELMTNV